MKKEKKSVIKTSGKKKPTTLNRVIYVLKVDHSLILVSHLCDDNHAIDFMNRGCVTRKGEYMVDASKCVNRTYSVSLQETGDEAFVILEPV